MKTNEVNTNKTSYLIKRFLPYFKKYKLVLVLDLLCATLTAVCDIILPLIIRYLTNLATGNAEGLFFGNSLGSAGSDSGGAAAIGGTELTVRIVLIAGIVYLVLRILDMGANYYMAYVGHVMGAKIETDMRTDLFGKMQELSYSYYSETKIGQLMSRITTDLFDIAEFAHHCPEEYYIAALKIGVSFVILCNVNVPLTLIIFAIIPIMIIVSLQLIDRMRTAFKRLRNQLGDINSQVEDSLLGIRVVKSFANEDVEEEKFNEGNEEFLDVKKETYHAMAWFQSSVRLFDGIMYVAVLIAGGLFLVYGKINVADFMAYMLYVVMLLAAVRRLVEFTEQFQRGMTGIERFVEVMDEPVEIIDKEDAVELSDVKGDIRFENASFRYGDSNEDVLFEINLHIKQGDSVALVGPSGSGKTTLCNLIPRFYDVTEGAIKVDGIDIRDVTTKSLRSNIGIVQQDVYLFSGSIFDNIEYGNPGADRKKIIEAAKLAGAHDFIMDLADGYDTFVGERGVKLSGGQKQRISIARVFLKNPPILILDEATSALDNESEKIVQDSLETLAKGRTTLTIAHRLTTIRNAEIILVLTDDGIEESGSHDELIAKGGLYSKLYGLYTDSGSGTAVGE